VRRGDNRDVGEVAFATTTAAPAAAAPAASGPRRLRLRWRDRRAARGRARPRGDVSARELALVVAGSAAVTVAMTWPLVLHLHSQIAGDLGDPVRTAWQVAWVGHALVDQPLHMFQANAFWPRANSLAFSDSLLGYAPLGAIGSGSGAALVRYNLLFLLSYVLAGVGAYLLARELGTGRAGAIVAAAAFAFAPFKLNMNGHLHVISSGGVPLCLFLLVRGYRRERPGLVVAGWLVAAWQVSLGFTLGLQLAYLLALLAAVVLILWWRRGRPRVPRPVLAATAAGLAACALVTAYQARPYMKVARDYPTAKRTLHDLERYSAPPKAFLAAPPESRVWGDITAGVRNTLSSKNESALFPGLTVLVLAGIGLAGPPLTRRLRLGLAAGAAVTAALSLGLGVAGGRFSYRLLYDFAPGWDGVRTPGRLATLTSLALALLAAAGTARLVRAIGSRSGARRRIAVTATGAVFAGLVLLEGSGTVGHPALPLAPAAARGLPGPQLHLPTDTPHDRLFQFWSTDGFPQIANGISTFEIPSLNDLRGGMHDFPDAQGVNKLEGLGIRTVVLHTDVMRLPLPALRGQIPEPPDPAAAARKPVRGLGIKRIVRPGVVIFEIPARRARR
jgi:hypothetical protein